MPLDTDAPISPLQSSTIKSALIAMAPQILLVITAVTGKVYDITVINQAINDGYSLVASGITLYYLYRTIRGRINATQTIQK